MKKKKFAETYIIADPDRHWSESTRYIVAGEDHVDWRPQGNPAAVRCLKFIADVKDVDTALILAVTMRKSRKNR